MVESTRAGTVSCRAESAQGPSQNGLYIFKSLLTWVHLSFPSIQQRPPDGWETIRWKDFWSPKDFVVYAPWPPTHVLLGHGSAKSLSVVSESLWPHGLTVAHQAPLSMGFSRQEHWSGLPFPTPGDLPNPEIQAVSLIIPALAGGFFTASAPEKYLLTVFSHWDVLCRDCCPIPTNTLILRVSLTLLLL